MKWLENLKSKLGAKEAGEKVFGSLVEAAEHARKHKGTVAPLFRLQPDYNGGGARTGISPNPFEARRPAASAETENRLVHNPH